MNESEPNDDVVRTAIIKAVSIVESYIRPNKLRKLICKDVEGTNWTQYQRVLDLMIEKKILKTCMISEELTICSLSNTSDKKDLSTKSGQDGMNTFNSRESSSSHSTKMKVPLAIVYHLVKKGQKKLKNLELNSKTKFSFTEATLLAVKKTDFDINEETSFIINSLDDSGDEEVAMKHIKTAKLYVSKMAKAFKVNPEHFCRRQAGGTMKEQQQAKKMKHDATQKRKKKIPTQNDKGKNEGETSQPKRKRRKFY